MRALFILAFVAVSALGCASTATANKDRMPAQAYNEVDPADSQLNKQYGSDAAEKASGKVVVYSACFPKETYMNRLLSVNGSLLTDGIRAIADDVAKLNKLKNHDFSPVACSVVNLATAGAKSLNGFAVRVVGLE